MFHIKGSFNLRFALGFLEAVYTGLSRYHRGFRGSGLEDPGLEFGLLGFAFRAWGF